MDSQKKMKKQQKKPNGYSSDEENFDMSKLGQVFSQYSGESEDLKKTQEFFENCFQNGQVICLICLGECLELFGTIWVNLTVLHP